MPISPEDQEVLDWCSDQNARHMHDTGQILDFLQWLHRITPVLPGGLSREDTTSMSLYQQIGVLEEISRDSTFQSTFLDQARTQSPGGAWHLFFGEMEDFLSHLDKEGFRSGLD